MGLPWGWGPLRIWAVHTDREFEAAVAVPSRLRSLHNRHYRKLAESQLLRPLDRLGLLTVAGGPHIHNNQKTTNHRVAVFRSYSDFSATKSPEVLTWSDITLMIMQETNTQAA